MGRTRKGRSREEQGRGGQRRGGEGRVMEEGRNGPPLWGQVYAPRGRSQHRPLNTPLVGLYILASAEGRIRTARVNSSRAIVSDFVS